MTDNPHHFEIELTDSDVPIIKQILRGVAISNATTRVRIEIDSQEPIFNEGADLGLNTPAPAHDSDSPADEKTDRPTVKTVVKRHTTNGETDDETTDDETTDEDDTDEDDTDKPTKAVEDYPLSTDTNKWYILGLLHRSRRPLTSKEVYEYLEGTPWELTTQSSVSAYFSTLRDDGVIEVADDSGTGAAKYHLTQYGKDVMEYTINSTSGYHLRVADKLKPAAEPTEDAKKRTDTPFDNLEDSL